MALPDLLTKIKSLIGIIADFFIDLGERITRAGFMSRIPEDKRLFVLLSVVGGLAVIFLVIVGTALLTRTPVDVSVPIESYPFQQALIPPDELFLPDEPDFVPGVLLERERRAQWTAEDAAPWWQDPLRNGEEPWRKRIEITVDALLERIP